MRTTVLAFTALLLVTFARGGGDDDAKTKATFKVEGMTDEEACPTAIATALNNGCNGIRNVEIAYKTKEGVVEFDPSKATVRGMCEVLSKTQKYSATLTKPVETSQTAGGATWTVRTEKSSYAPGTKGKLDLWIDCGKGALYGYKMDWMAPEGVKLSETTKEKKTGVAGSLHVPVEFEIGKDFDKPQFLVRVTIACQTDRKGTTASLVLNGVVVLEPAKK